MADNLTVQETNNNTSSGTTIVFEKLAVLLVKDTTGSTPTWKPIPAISGQSVTLESATPTSVDGRDGFKYTIYDERTASSTTFTIWDGKDGVDGNNTVVVDGQYATASGSYQVVNLNAVRYTSQSLSSTEQAAARANINAMAAISGTTTGSIIRYNGTGWVEGTINEVPAAAGVTNGYVLTASNSAYNWSLLDVSAITTADINALFS